MYRQRNIRLLISLIALMIITAVVYWSRSINESLVADEHIFRVEDFNVVDSITLTSPFDTVRLHYNGARWRVNDTYDADRQLIDVLFATLQGVKPRRPVAETMRDSVEKRLTLEGVEVSMFANGEQLKTFVAGGNRQKTQAWFMESETGVPYLMTIPGYRVYASGIFELTENGWRDKYVFAFNWRNFQQLDVSFPRNQSDGFTVVMNEHYVDIQGVSEPDTARLNEFLDKVSLLTVNEYLPNDKFGEDSILRKTPQMEILVKDIGQREYSLNIYPGEYRPGEVLAQVNGSQPVLIDSRKISAILRPKSYFLAK